MDEPRIVLVARENGYAGPTEPTSADELRAFADALTSAVTDRTMGEEGMWELVASAVLAEREAQLGRRLTEWRTIPTTPAQLILDVVSGRIPKP